MDNLGSILQGLGSNWRFLSNIGNNTVTSTVNGNKLSLNSYVTRITTSTTTTAVASTAPTPYIHSISIVVEVAGNGSTITIGDGSSPQNVVINGISGTSATTVPLMVEFLYPTKMSSGIKIITSGSSPATYDVFILYWA